MAMLGFSHHITKQLDDGHFPKKEFVNENFEFLATCQKLHILQPECSA